MGYLEKRGNGWRLNVYDPSGKQRYKRRQVNLPQTTDGKRQAKKELAKFELQVQAGEADTAEEVAFEPFARQWLEDGRNTPEMWVDSYADLQEGFLNNYLIPAFGNRPLSQITGGRIQKLFTEMSAKGLSVSTIRSVATTINQIFDRAVKWDLLDINPMTKAKRPKGRPKTRSAPDLDDMKAALDHVLDSGDHVFFTYLAVACDTGARLESLLGLQWRDVDFEGELIHFRRSVVKGSNGTTVRAGTKTHTTYTAPLNDSIAGALERWKIQYELLYGEAGPEDHLFRSARSAKHWNPSTPTHKWNRVREHLDLDFTLHEATRHFVATQMLNDGTPPQQVAQQLNHASVATTTTVYSHYIEGANKEASRRHSDRLFSR